MQPQQDPFIVPPCLEDISIVFQDEHLVLLNKPSGLLSLSGKHPLNEDSVHFRLVQRYPSATLLHRLDFGTSGIMIAALNKTINSEIGKQFQNGSVAKTYTALLFGHLAGDTGDIVLPIAKDVLNFPLQKICYATGKMAHTRYQVLDRVTSGETKSSTCTRVVYTPTSGRTHQLRIHSRELGHPILGCDLYATDEAFFMAKRLMLHATTIEFTHPITGRRQRAVAHCPF